MGYFHHMRSYKFLLFDADGTLYDFKASEKIALKNLFSHYNIPLTEENVAIYHRNNSQCWKEYEEGTITMEVLKTRRFTTFFKEAGIKADDYEAGRLFIRYLGDAGILIEGAREVISTLKESYTLAIITNGIADVQRARLINSGTMDDYAQIIISEEIGIQKPNAEFFRIALERLGAKREECLIIGDSLTSDIQGGVNSGIDTLYLHLESEADPEKRIWTYDAGDYATLLSCLRK